MPTHEEKAETVDENGLTDSWKRELFARLNRVRLICGELCALNDAGSIAGVSQPNPTVPELPIVTVPSVVCPNIVGMKEADAEDLTYPATVPEELRNYYTLDGEYGFKWDRIRREAPGSTGSIAGGSTGGDDELESSSGSEAKPWGVHGTVWREDHVNLAVAQIGEGTFQGAQGVAETNRLRDALSGNEWTDYRKYDAPAKPSPDSPLRGKSVLVIGSSSFHPWIEAICLHHGARKVTTLEHYGTVRSEHPLIETETPRSFRSKYLNGTLEMFDGVIAHSATQHLGLGRYGDALNPWGDLLASARAWCVTKPGGFGWFAVPTGRDAVLYNWHRVYGRSRWPLLAANWKTRSSLGGMHTERTVPAKLRQGFITSMKNDGFLFEKIGQQQ